MNIESHKVNVISPADATIYNHLVGLQGAITFLFSRKPSRNHSTVNGLSEVENKIIAEIKTKHVGNPYLVEGTDEYKALKEVYRKSHRFSMQMSSLCKGKYVGGYILQSNKKTIMYRFTYRIRNNQISLVSVGQTELVKN